MTEDFIPPLNGRQIQFETRICKNKHVFILWNCQQTNVMKTATVHRSRSACFLVRNIDSGMNSKITIKIHYKWISLGDYIVWTLLNTLLERKGIWMRFNQTFFSWWLLQKIGIDVFLVFIVLMVYSRLTKYPILLYSWKIFPNSSRSHWLLRGNMTPNNDAAGLRPKSMSESMTSKGNSAKFPVACSRLRDGGGKSFSNKKGEKRAGAGERQGGGACTHFFNGLFRYISSWFDSKT